MGCSYRDASLASNQGELQQAQLQSRYENLPESFGLFCAEFLWIRITACDLDSKRGKPVAQIEDFLHRAGKVVTDRDQVRGRQFSIEPRRVPVDIARQQGGIRASTCVSRQLA